MTFEYIVGGVASAIAIVYLVYVLFFPEKF